jgi:adhesin transport system membrane fusion protein
MIGHHPDPDRGPRRAARITVLLIIAFALVAIAWALVGTVDVSVSARGRIVAPSSVQQVQSLEGGIVRELLVQAGQRVKTGQVLVRLDTTQYQAELGEGRQNWLAALAALARLDALLTSQSPQFPPEVLNEAPALVQQETRLWQDAQHEYTAALHGGQDQISKEAATLQEARARMQSLEPAVKLAQESLAIEEGLYKQGAGAKADYLNAQQRLLSQKADLDALRQSLPRLEASLALARSQSTEQAARMRSQWGAQRTELQAKSSSYANQLKTREDRAARRELTAPIDGIVNRVLVPTRGGVATAGETILEIVPAEAAPRILAKVKPDDIGFIHPGQRAAVRIMSYDSSVYGKLMAEVERVGADALTDDQHQPYFEVTLRSEQPALVHDGKALPLTPGMTTEASILTGKRTVMQYLLKPILKSFDMALQER